MNVNVLTTYIYACNPYVTLCYGIVHVLFLHYRNNPPQDGSVRSVILPAATVLGSATANCIGHYLDYYDRLHRNERFLTVYYWERYVNNRNDCLRAGVCTFLLYTACVYFLPFKEFVFSLLHICVTIAIIPFQGQLGFIRHVTRTMCICTPFFGVHALHTGEPIDWVSCATWFIFQMRAEMGHEALCNDNRARTDTYNLLYWDVISLSASTPFIALKHSYVKLTMIVAFCALNTVHRHVHIGYTVEEANIHLKRISIERELLVGIVGSIT
jgi:hypothetical protein